MTTDENTQKTLNWTTSKEWGTEGLTYQASYAGDGAEKGWQFVVNRPRKYSPWVVRGWLDGEFRMYREARTAREGKALAADKLNGWI